MLENLLNYCSWQEKPVELAPLKALSRYKRGTKMKTTLKLQTQGYDVADKDVVAKVKEVWIATGNKVKDLKTLEMFFNAEEATVYYTINEEVSGKLHLSEVTE